MTNKPKRVAFYCRVSTDGQTIENQLNILQISAQRNGWEVVRVYKDEGISGGKGKDRRPGLAELMKGIARKEFDLVAAWSLDRLGRSLQDLIGLLGDIQAKGIDLYLEKQAIDTSTPTGKMLFQILGSFAEFEREMIRERVGAGLQRARKQGKVLGRPKKVDEDLIAAILKARAEGKGIRTIAKEIGIGIGTVQRVLKAS